MINGTNDFQNSYTYDRLNRQTSIVQQGASGGNTVGYKKTTFGYNAGSEVTSIADYTTSTAELMHASLAYDRAERLTSIQWHDDAHTGSGYGGFGSTGYWEQLTYGNDNNSRVTGITSTEYSSENASYTYDHTGQLTQDDLGYGGYGGILRHLFSWDANGNPTSSSVGTSTGYGGFSYVTDSGYLLGAGNRLLSDGNYKYVYDASGNLITRYGIATGTIAESDYTWDNRNRLVEVQNRGTVGGSVTLDITYVYDIFDRLISRTQGSTTTLFAYDGKRMVLAFTSSGGITDRFLWGPAVDQILADEHYTTPSTTSAGTTKWAVFDKQNSVRDLVLSSDSLANHVVYDSFGAVASGGDPILFLHEGVFTDPSTGMEWHSDPASGFPGRWYDPAAKRWLSEDPTGLIPDSNPYRDVHNSPTNRVDPSGLWDEELFDWYVTTDSSNSHVQMVLQYRIVPGPLDKWLPGAGYINLAGYPDHREKKYPLNTVAPHEANNRYALLKLLRNPRRTETFVEVNNILAIEHVAECGRNKVTGTMEGFLFATAATMAGAAISFGRNSNSTYHAFRHVADAGMDPAAVQAAIEADISANGGTFGSGSNVRTIGVGGQDISYNAYLFDDGSINVGKIVLPR